MTKVKFSVYQNNKSIDRYEVKILKGVEEKVYLGRGSDAQLQINDPRISRLHAVFNIYNEIISYKKLSEYENIFINGQSVEQAILTKDDTVTFYDYQIKLDIEKPPEIKEEIGKKENVSKEQELVSGAETLQENSNRTVILSTKEVLGDLQGVEVEAEKNEVDGSLTSSDSSFEATNSFENIEKNIEDQDVSEFREFDYTGSIQAKEIFTADDSKKNDDSDFTTLLSDDSSFTSVDDLSVDSEPPPESFPIESIDRPEVDQDDATQVIANFVNFYLKLFGENIPFSEYKLEKPITIIGRSQKCDIVIDDPELSGRHLQITLEGSDCYLEDLNSSNGTWYQGEKVQKVPLNAKDEFLLGSTSIVLEVKSSALDEEYENLMPVEEHEEVLKPDFTHSEDELDFSEDSSKKLTLKDRFDELLKDPKKKRIFYALAGLVFIWILFDDDPAPTQKKKKKVSTVESSSLDDKAKKRRTKEEKEFLEVHYKIGKKKTEEGDFGNALYELDLVKQVDPSYKRVAELYIAAKDGLQRLEQAEKDRKTSEVERAKQIKIENLLGKIKKALQEKRLKIAEMYYSQILEIDPANIEAGGLREEIVAYQEEATRILEQKQEEAKIQAKYEGVMVEVGENIHDKYYHKSITLLENFIKNNKVTDELGKKIRDQIANYRKSLLELVTPILNEAISLKTADDHKGSYELYKKVFDLDPGNEKAFRELASIKKTLEVKARKLFREALISESISLFSDAKNKYLEVLQVAPSDSEYYKKASRKIKDFYWE